MGTLANDRTWRAPGGAWPPWLAGVTKFNLHNNVTDASWMNEVLYHRLYRDAGVPAPRTAYAAVYVTVPGQYAREYLGLYSLVENVDNRFAVDRFGTRKGALFKPVTRQLFEVDTFKRLYLDRMREFSQTIFRPERFHGQVDEPAAVLRSWVQQESEEKRVRFHQVVAGEAVGPPPFGGGFTGPLAQDRRGPAAGPGGMGPGGGPPDFGPGLFLGPIFLTALDTDKTGEVTETEFDQGFARWFQAWDSDQNGILGEAELRAGIDQDLSPFRGGPPPLFGFGPPGGVPTETLAPEPMPESVP